MNPKYRRLLSRQDWRYSQAGTSWTDGLLLGNGSLAAISYAPSSLEWVINKNDVFPPVDNQEALKAMLTHKQVMDHIAKKKIKNSKFLDEAEAYTPNPALRFLGTTITPAILRLRFWEGIGWSAPSIPLTSQHLDFYNGCLEEAMDAHTFHPRLQMFIPRNLDTFCLRIREDGHPERPHIFELIRPAHAAMTAPQWHDGASCVSFVQPMPGGKLSYAVSLAIVPRNGGSPASFVQRTANCTELSQTGDADIFLSVASSFSCAAPLAEVQKIAAGFLSGETTFEQQEKINQDWWHDYWGRTYADFGKEKEFQKYFTFGLYELACAYGKAPMPGLNGMGYGPINEQTGGVFCPAYAHDQNAQISAYPIMPLNHLELLPAFTGTYWRQRRKLRQFTRKYFGCEGICLPLGMNQLGNDICFGAYRYTMCGSAYTSAVLSLAWKYSRDVELLRKHIYPLLRELVIFHFGIMKKGKDGMYHLDYTVPPEIFTFTRDDSAMTSMFKSSLAVLIETSAILGRDAKQRPRWQEIYDHLPDICKTPDGALWCGPDVPYDHYFFGGHLWLPYFPSELTEDTGLVRKTFEFIKKEACEFSCADLPGQWHLNHEWSMFLTTTALLRSGDRKRGLPFLRRFLEFFAKENGLFSHDPILIADPAITEQAQKDFMRLHPRQQRRSYNGGPLPEDDYDVPKPYCVTPNPQAKRLAPAVQEGNSAFLFMASEILLQSHGGILRPFCMVPDSFSGSFLNFLAEGGFLVSGEMKDGVLQSLTVKATVDGICRLQLPGKKKIQEIKLANGQVYHFARD